MLSSRLGMVSRRWYLSCCLLIVHLTGAAAATEELAPLPIKIPLPSPLQLDVSDTKRDIGASDTNTHALRPPFLAPRGATNVALGKFVFSKAKILHGSLRKITDGNKDFLDEDVVELDKGLQYVQVDLEQEFTLHAIVLWHDYRLEQKYHCVIIQIADDVKFTQRVRTVFNNDAANDAGLGRGQDEEYPETHEGRLIDAKREKARFLRWYSQGSSLTSLNCRQEIEVYGTP